MNFFTYVWMVLLSLPLRPYSSCYKYTLQVWHGRTKGAEAGGLSWVLGKSELHNENNRMKSGFKTQIHRLRKGLVTVRDFYYFSKNIFILLLCFKPNRIQLSVKQSFILSTLGCYWFMYFSCIANHFLFHSR